MESNPVAKSTITSNELDGNAALRRFLRHLSRHFIGWDKPSGAVENFSIDPSMLAARDHCDVALVARAPTGEMELLNFFGIEEALKQAAASGEGVLRCPLEPTPALSEHNLELLVRPRDTSAEVTEPIRQFIEAHKDMISSFVQATARYPTNAELPIEPPRMGDTQTTDIDEQITALFESTLLKRRLARSADEDFWDKGGRGVFRSTVHRYTSTGRRILFLLPAFPFKSSNTETKVLGTEPDMGEYLAIRRLDEFMEEICKLYAPGAHLVLFSDGRVYCDLFGIDDGTTSRFKQAVRTVYSSKHITWSDLDEFFAGSDDHNKRVALEGLFGASPQRVLERISNDPDFTETYCGFKKFMTEELAVGHRGQFTANSQRVKEITRTARGLMRRNFAYGIMMKVLFREHIRLSIHPSSNGNTLSQTGAKFAVNLVGVTDWGTPWHNCAVLHNDGSWTLMRRSEAIRQGFELTMSDQGLLYFRERSLAADATKLDEGAEHEHLSTSSDSVDSD